MVTKKQLAKKIHDFAHTQNQQPGIESKMRPKPLAQSRQYQGTGKLKGKVAIITGGDSGIGHAVALCFAKEGANIVIAYLNEHADARKTKEQVNAVGQGCLLIAGDLSKEAFCKKVINQTIKHFGKLDILVNNAAEQFPQKSIVDITAKQLLKTFSINIFSFFYMIKAALPLLKKGSTIINTASVTCYKGSKYLLDYSATKGAIVALTRSLSESLTEKGIRVNGVAPGPIWTPLIPASFDKKRVKEFGKNVPMKRPGQPDEIGPCYVFLASEDSSYMSGQFLHPNGGVIVNG
jgi:NAD(P)-dependent dehydrogenase (short-subunit alcohol dehydrogenase family)